MFLFIAVVSWFCLMTIASFGPHDAEDIDKDFFFWKRTRKKISLSSVFQVHLPRLLNAMPWHVREFRSIYGCKALMSP